MQKHWLHYAKWRKMPTIKPGWSIKTPIKRSPVHYDFDHVSPFGLFTRKYSCYWDMRWTTFEHSIDRTLVQELNLVDNDFCIYEKIKKAWFFWHTLYMKILGTDKSETDFWPSSTSTSTSTQDTNPTSRSLYFCIVSTGRPVHGNVLWCHWLVLIQKEIRKPKLKMKFLQQGQVGHYVYTFWNWDSVE